MEIKDSITDGGSTATHSKAISGCMAWKSSPPRAPCGTNNIFTPLACIGVVTLCLTVMLANCTINCNLIGPYLPPSPSSDVVYLFMLKGSTIQHCICRDMWKYKKIPKSRPALTNRGRKLRKYPILPITHNHAKQISDI